MQGGSVTTAVAELTVAEIARRTPYTEPQIRAMLRRGELEPVRVGGRLFIPVAEAKRALGALFRENNG